MVTAARAESAPEPRSKLVLEALEAAKKGADLGASRYNLACALAVSGEKDRALKELKDCLARDDVTKDWVRKDPDWESLRGDPDFEALLE